MDDEQRLYGLMAIAEEQQKLVATLTGKMAVGHNAMLELGQEIRKIASQGINEAVAVAVAEVLADLSEDARKQLDDAVLPVVAQIANAGQAAAAIDGNMTATAKKWTWLIAGYTLAGILLIWCVAYGSVWWQREQVVGALEQKQALQADIEQLQKNVASLEKRGARLKMTTCGGRVCIEASRNQGGDNKDWRGPWKTNDGTPLVIPSGY